MPKFTGIERLQIKNLVALLSIKRIPDSEIAGEIERQTGKSITNNMLFRIRQQIKRESYQWYQKLREGEYEYLHEFKERINEIVDLQKRHYTIIEDNANNPSIQQTSLAELHKLNITLSNYFDVAPSIVNGVTLSTTQQGKTTTTENRDLDAIIV
jgi:hypothetical protein